jgi:ferric-dicitrate binding protein FerR (iron transport regulator)
MSLAPAERRALDIIEDGLRGSDRRLARMLTRFQVPLARGGLVILIRGPGRRRRLISSAIVVTVVALLAVVIWHDPGAPPALHQGRTAITTQDSTGGSSNSQAGP